MPDKSPDLTQKDASLKIVVTNTVSVYFKFKEESFAILVRAT